jgi:uncharacterized protein (DUF4415 family)
MNKPSGTDWERIDAMTDDEIDTSDIPPLTDTFFKRATIRLPKRLVTMTVQVDSDVLDWFKAQGQDYEQRINAALRIYAEAHKSAQR